MRLLSETSSLNPESLSISQSSSEDQITHQQSIDAKNQPRPVPDNLYQSRLATIWNGLMATEISNGWRKILAIMTAEEWQGYIAQNTPSHVQKLLGSQSAPTIFALEALGRQGNFLSKCVVIYAYILTPRRRLFLESEWLVLLGSTTNNRRLGRWNWQLMTDREVNFWLRRFFQFRLEKPLFKLMCNPIPLFQIPYEWETREEEGRSAALSRIAQAVYTIWLRAVVPKMKPAIIGMAPWDRDCIRYRGLRKYMR
ncbi:MAG: hypothetical protein Q9212_002378 [Teloschistes hypoglaucus]